MFLNVDKTAFVIAADEAIISDSVDRIDLDINLWKNRIYRRVDNNNHKNTVYDNSFDAKLVSERLKRFYLNIMKSKCFEVEK